MLHDLMLAGVSFPAALFLRAWGAPLRDGGQQTIGEILRVSADAVPLLLLLAVGVFSTFGLYRSIWRYASAADLSAVFKAVCLLMLLFVPALFLVDRLSGVARSVPLIQWMFLLVALGGSRIAYAFLFARRAGGGRVHYPSLQPVLVIGGGDAAALLIELLQRRTGAHVQPVGVLDDRPELQNRHIRRVPVLGGLADLHAAVATLAVHGMRPRSLVLAAPVDSFDGDSLASLLQQADALGLGTRTLTDLLHVEELGQDPARHAVPVELDKLGRRSFFAIKRLADITVALAGLLLTAPLMLLICALVCMSLGRPVIFHQMRPGRGLQAFTLYKFRTLVDQPPGLRLSDEQRLTPVGRLLRRTRLDELPQLWNVLIGDMSLVGPRPLLPRDLPDLGEAMHERFLVRPGITGWAQVNGGHQLRMNDKLALDIWYIRNYSPLLDLKIAAKTAWMMVFGEKIDSKAIERATA
ncbi:exopolysaccharide biosynthesis polyprenyl glycosylphosphotransferase [Geminicoccaceae bacterium 1502E]|nr:exopolysaccharide biosynthesis polyprenyl glycosylphosphotransferase [Geminicoccaceae bacterium 1502E]